MYIICNFKLFLAAHLYSEETVLEVVSLREREREVFMDEAGSTPNDFEALAASCPFWPGDLSLSGPARSERVGHYFKSRLPPNRIWDSEGDVKHWRSHIEADSKGVGRRAGYSYVTLLRRGEIPARSRVDIGAA